MDSIDTSLTAGTRTPNPPPPSSAGMLELDMCSSPLDLTFVGLSHDVMQALTAAKGWVQYLDRSINRCELRRHDEVNRALLAIEAATVHLQQLVEETLDYARHASAGSPAIRPQPTDLVRLLNEVATEGTDELHPVTVRAEMSALVGMWDPTQLRRVFSNLVDNAVKYSPDGGEILITVRRAPALPADTDEQYALVKVHDCGVGIPPSNLPYIFEPYYRGDNVARHTSGSGIGLSTLSQILALHGGGVSVESQEGGGATFSVHLPLVQA